MENKYLLRKKILEILFNYQKNYSKLLCEKDFTSEIEFSMSLKEIKLKTKYSEDEILYQLEILVNKNLIKELNDDFEKLYVLTKTGRIEYLDKLNEKLSKELIQKKIKMIIFIIISIISIINFIYNFIK